MSHSHHSPSGHSSQPQCPSALASFPPELAERIHHFQEAAQALLACYEPEAPQRSVALPALGEPGKAREQGEAREAGHTTQRQHTAVNPAGETRSYYFPPAALRKERELLHKYRADDLSGLLAEAHILLVGLVKTMKSIHPDARLRGYVISSLGCLLEQASALTLRMRNVYDEVKRV